MGTNLLIALSNLIKNPIVDINSFYRSTNRINSVGDALELYIKDIFCNSLNEKNLNKKISIFSKYFSYDGNQNNPPDLMIKNGDAIEVKKIEGPLSGIALNSSYPKNKLYFNDPMLTQACKDCEDWKEKDIIYAIGTIKNNKLKVLWFVYGDCYAADKEIYQRIKKTISVGINELQGIQFSETNELGRVNRVDPLGITYLRIRGMWHIENPTRVFNYLTSNLSQNGELIINAIISKKKYLSFPEKDKNNLEKLKNKKLLIKDVKIKSPNNPAKLLDAKLIRFSK